jgi:integrase
LDESRVSKVFRRALVKAGLAHRRVYDCRHTFAALLLSAGAPLVYVAAQLGHRKPTTTLRYYARYIPSEGDRWADLTDRLEPHVGTEGHKARAMRR